MKYLFIFLLMVIYTNLYAFNSKKCFSESNKDAWVSGYFIVTTSQSTTSTGDCSLLAMNTVEEKKKYVAENFYKLRIDSALGRGQFLAEYLYLNNCSDIPSLQGKVKQKYNYIFSDSEPSKTYIRLNSVLRNSNRCLISG